MDQHLRPRGAVPGRDVIGRDVTASARQLQRDPDVPCRRVFLYVARPRADDQRILEHVDARETT